MAYREKNGKIYKLFFHHYWDERGRLCIGDGWWYVGEAPPRTIFSFALKIMSKYENREETSRSEYKYAQRVACCKLVGKPSWSNFIRERNEPWPYTHLK